MNEIKLLSDEKYFVSEGLSNSYLKLFDRSPMHAERFEYKSKALDEGSLIHLYILQLEEFYKTYVIAPEDIQDRRKKNYKDFQKLHEGKEIILHKDYCKLEKLRENIMDYRIRDDLTMLDIMTRSQNEISIFWEEFGVQRKAKIDMLYLNKEYNIAIDLKKTTDCLDFKKSVSKYQYQRQAATIIDGLIDLTDTPTMFILLTFEYQEPFGVKAYVLSKDYIQSGRVQNLASIERWKSWVSRGKPQEIYDNGVELIEKPEWL